MQLRDPPKPSPTLRSTMTTKTDQIRMLNDQLRKQFVGGTAVMTPGVAALGQEAVERIVQTIAVFDEFCHANDPHEEHDFDSDREQTIYLAEGWSGGTAAGLSILVHEMVHHFQNVLGVKHECPQEREKLAYKAQDRWLSLFGHTLETDFELDGFSLLAKTGCFY
jgi:hypothetical protein